jgi:hypothetical protein
MWFDKALLRYRKAHAHSVLFTHRSNAPRWNAAVDAPASSPFITQLTHPSQHKNQHSNNANVQATPHNHVSLDFDECTLTSAV